MNKNAPKNEQGEVFLQELLSLKDQVLFDGRFTTPAGTKNIVVAGMGGSGIAGMIFEELYSKVPVIFVNSYEIPKFVDSSTLFIALSYSGNTEETLSATKRAKEQGANTVAITTGGELAKECKTVIKIPTGLQPRSALGYMLMPMLNSLDIVSKDEINEAYNVLQKIDSDNSEQKKIAGEIFANKSIPVIYGTSPNNSIAYRWNTQFNENSKLLSLWSNFPELNHNNTMAIKGTYRAEEFYYICLVSNSDQKIRNRIRATEEVTGVKFNRIIEAQGNSEFAKLMSMIHMANYVTYHLAELIGVDPLEVASIEALKAKLK